MECTSTGRYSAGFEHRRITGEVIHPSRSEELYTGTSLGNN